MRISVILAHSSGCFIILCDLTGSPLFVAILTSHLAHSAIDFEVPLVIPDDLQRWDGATGRRSEERVASHLEDRVETRWSPPAIVPDEAMQIEYGHCLIGLARGAIARPATARQLHLSYLR